MAWCNDCRNVVRRVFDTKLSILDTETLGGLARAGSLCAFHSCDPPCVQPPHCAQLRVRLGGWASAPARAGLQLQHLCRYGPEHERAP